MTRIVLLARFGCLAEVPTFRVPTPPFAVTGRAPHCTHSTREHAPRPLSGPLPRTPCPCSLGSQDFCLKYFREQHFSLRRSNMVGCLRSAVRRITVPYRQGFERLRRKGNEG
jgi:hypothetical protein